MSVMARADIDDEDDIVMKSKVANHQFRVGLEVFSIDMD